MEKDIKIFMSSIGDCLELEIHRGFSQVEYFSNDSLRSFWTNKKGAREFSSIVDLIAEKVGAPEVAKGMHKAYKIGYHTKKGFVWMLITKQGDMTLINFFKLKSELMFWVNK